MVMSRVVDYAVTWYGLSVSDTEVAQLRANQKQAWGGEPVMEQALLVKRGVAAGQIDDFYREQLGLGKLAAMSGKQLGTADGNKVVHALLASASAELKVTVNPRYGSWDAQQSIVSTSLDPWLPDRHRRLGECPADLAGRAPLGVRPESSAGPRTVAR